MAPKGAKPQQPSVKETLNHPRFPAVVWDLEPHRQGKLNVSKTKGKPVNLAWEIHGSGPIKVAFIMGMGEPMTAWQFQTLYFGHERGGRFTVLIIDNRGMGRSDKPLSFYNTTQMADEIIQVLDHVEWTGNRDINIIGISLGGMIAQKVARTVPERVQSLILLSTAAKFIDLVPSFKEVRNWLSLVQIGEKREIDKLARLMFPNSWLAALDREGDPSASTPRFKPSVDHQDGLKEFESNFQKFQAFALHKRRDGDSFTQQGLMCQVVATASHRVSDADLRAMADAVGRERIMVVHGTVDGLLPVEKGRHLIDVIKPADGLIVEGMGHVPIFERNLWLDKLMEDKLEACHKF